ncbi:hypothetical protein MP228_003830 [Amoeboaphelidium protococcarum]|nr:hypothetical protein MP228_003830 [Amoeboaphelidium protococcarum]
MNMEKENVENAGPPVKVRRLDIGKVDDAVAGTRQLSVSQKVLFNTDMEGIDNIQNVSIVQFSKYLYVVAACTVYQLSEDVCSLSPFFKLESAIKCAVPSADGKHLILVDDQNVLRSLSVEDGTIVKEIHLERNVLFLTICSDLGFILLVFEDYHCCILPEHERLSELTCDVQKQDAIDLSCHVKGQLLSVTYAEGEVLLVSDGQFVVARIVDSRFEVVRQFDCSQFTNLQLKSVQILDARQSLLLTQNGDLLIFDRRRATLVKQLFNGVQSFKSFAHDGKQLILIEMIDGKFALYELKNLSNKIWICNVEESSLFIRSLGSQLLAFRIRRLQSSSNLQLLELEFNADPVQIVLNFINTEQFDVAFQVSREQGINFDKILSQADTNGSSGPKLLEWILLNAEALNCVEVMCKACQSYIPASLKQLQVISNSIHGKIFGVSLSQAVSEAFLDLKRKFETFVILHGEEVDVRQWTDFRSQSWIEILLQRVSQKDFDSLDIILIRHHQRDFQWLAGDLKQFLNAISGDINVWRYSKLLSMHITPAAYKDLAILDELCRWAYDQCLGLADSSIDEALKLLQSVLDSQAGGDNQCITPGDYVKMQSMQPFLVNERPQSLQNLHQLQCNMKAIMALEKGLQLRLEIHQDSLSQNSIDLVCKVLDSFTTIDSLKQTVQHESFCSMFAQFQVSKDDVLLKYCQCMLESFGAATQLDEERVYCILSLISDDTSRSQCQMSYLQCAKIPLSIDMQNFINGIDVGENEETRDLISILKCKQILWNHGYHGVDFTDKAVARKVFRSMCTQKSVHDIYYDLEILFSHLADDLQREILVDILKCCVSKLSGDEVCFVLSKTPSRFFVLVVEESIEYLRLKTMRSKEQVSLSCMKQLNILASAVCDSQQIKCAGEEFFQAMWSLGSITSKIIALKDEFDISLTEEEFKCSDVRKPKLADYFMKKSYVISSAEQSRLCYLIDLGVEDCVAAQLQSLAVTTENLPMDLLISQMGSLQNCKVEMFGELVALILRASVSGKDGDFSLSVLDALQAVLNSSLQNGGEQDISGWLSLLQSVEFFSIVYQTSVQGSYQSSIIGYSSSSSQVDVMNRMRNILFGEQYDDQSLIVNTKEACNLVLGFILQRLQYSSNQVKKVSSKKAAEAAITCSDVVSFFDLNRSSLLAETAIMLEIQSKQCLLEECITLLEKVAQRQLLKIFTCEKADQQLALQLLLSLSQRSGFDCIKNALAHVNKEFGRLQSIAEVGVGAALLWQQRSFSVQLETLIRNAKWWQKLTSLQIDFVEDRFRSDPEYVKSLIPVLLRCTNYDLQLIVQYCDDLNIESDQPLYSYVQLMLQECPNLDYYKTQLIAAALSVDQRAPLLDIIKLAQQSCSPFDYEKIGTIFELVKLLDPNDDISTKGELILDILKSYKRVYKKDYQSDVLLATEQCDTRSLERLPYHLLVMNPWLVLEKELSMSTLYQLLPLSVPLSLDQDKFYICTVKSMINSSTFEVAEFKLLLNKLKNIPTGLESCYSMVVAGQGKLAQKVQALKAVLGMAEKHQSLVECRALVQKLRNEVVLKELDLILEQFKLTQFMSTFEGAYDLIQALHIDQSVDIKVVEKVCILICKKSQCNLQEVLSDQYLDLIKTKVARTTFKDELPSIALKKNLCGVQENVEYVLQEQLIRIVTHLSTEVRINLLLKTAYDQSTKISTMIRIRAIIVLLKVNSSEEINRIHKYTDICSYLQILLYLADCEDLKISVRTRELYKLDKVAFARSLWVNRSEERKVIQFICNLLVDYNCFQDLALWKKLLFKLIDQNQIRFVVPLLERLNKADALLKQSDILPGILVKCVCSIEIIQDHGLYSMLQSLLISLQPANYSLPLNTVLESIAQYELVDKLAIIQLLVHYDQNIVNQQVGEALSTSEKSELESLVANSLVTSRGIVVSFPIIRCAAFQFINERKLFRLVYFNQELRQEFVQCMVDQDCVDNIIEQCISTKNLSLAQEVLTLYYHRWSDKAPPKGESDLLTHFQTSRK